MDTNNACKKMVHVMQESKYVECQKPGSLPKKTYIQIDRSVNIIQNNNVIPMKKQKINQIYAKLENPNLNLCFINSAIQFILSIEPLADLISCSYIRNYDFDQNFLREFENLAILMLKHPSETFSAVKLAKEFEILEDGYVFGRQWDCSSVIDLFFTQYQKFIEKFKIVAYKMKAQEKLNSIMTTIIFTTECNVCNSKTIREVLEIFYYVSLEKDKVNIFKPFYNYSDVYRCELCNTLAGNPDPPLITGAIRKSEIRDISKYMLIKLGRVKLNGIDKLTYKVTIPESNNIKGKKIKLEAWVQHIGHTVLSGHYVLIRRINQSFLHMSDDNFTKYKSTSILKCSFCYIAVLKTI